MKKILLISALSLCLSCHYLIIAQDTIRVACIGNSITEGVGLVENIESYPVQLGVMLGAKWNVINFGVSGTTMLKSGDLPYWNTSKFKDALNFLPQKVIIELGTNDSKANNWKYKADFYSDYVSMIDTFEQLSSKPEIWIACPSKVFKNLYNITDKVISGQINPIIKQVAQDKGVNLVDLYDTTAYYPNLSYDGIHPNIGGAYFLAKIYYELFTKTKTKAYTDQNVLFKKKITASGGTVQDSLIDGSLSSKWSIGTLPAWVTIDIGAIDSIDNFQLFFAGDKNKGFQYTIESSLDSSIWNTVVDQSARNDTIKAYSTDNIAPKPMRYIKLTITSLSNSAGDSINLYEFKALKYHGYRHAPILYAERTNESRVNMHVAPQHEEQIYSFTGPAVAGTKTYKVDNIYYAFVKDTIAIFAGKTGQFNRFATNAFDSGIEVNSDTVGFYFNKYPVYIKTNNIGSADILLYPNPFNNKITISNLPNSSNLLSVEIFAIDGKLVKILSSVNVDSKNSLIWDGTDMASNKVLAGIYFCRVESKQFILTRKIILLK